jgi:hypothetical protein
MRKIVFILVFLTSSVYANIKPEVFVGGQFKFNAARTTQNAEYERDSLPRTLQDGNPNNQANNLLNKDGYFSQDAHIDFLILGKTDNATLYGARAVIELDSQRQNVNSFSNTDPNASSSTTNGSNGNFTGTNESRGILTRRAFMFFEKRTFGRFEIGDVEGPSKKMKFDAGYRFGGTGGISGDWWKYVNIPTFGLTYDTSKGDGLVCDGSAVSTDPAVTTASLNYELNDIRSCNTSENSGFGNRSFIIRPDLPLAHGYNRVEGADKFDDTRTIARVTYFSPRVSGIQFGVSYAPDSGDRGSSYYGQGFSGKNSSDAFDILDAGINYVEQFGDIGVGVSLTGEYGFAEDDEFVDTDKFIQQDLNAYALGAYVFFGNFSISGSIGEWNDSLMTVRESLDEGDEKFREDVANYQTIGLGYQFGPYNFGVSHMASEYREQNFTITSIALDYRLSKNLTFYAENNVYEFDAHKDDIEISESSQAQVGNTFNNTGNVILIGAKLRFGEFDSASQMVLDTSRAQY